MSTKLKKLADQVMVITGASSGIGLATAEVAAKKGAKLVLAARSEATLNEIVGRLTAAGYEAIAVGCDVADRSQVDGVAQAAVTRFGRIDTWVNNAGLGLYGRLDEVSEADSRRLFDVNFWGVVNGSLAALPHLKTNGGALINVGSEVSEAYVPLLGMYTATKHAVKGFTDALRVEIEDIDKAPRRPGGRGGGRSPPLRVEIEDIDKAPVSITLIQPQAVDTPFPQHARNYMATEAKLPKPQIDPEKVADAILDAATSPTRDKRVGMMAKVNTTLATLTPSIADRMAAGQVEKFQADEPARNREGALHRPSEATGVAGRTTGAGPK